MKKIQKTPILLTTAATLACLTWSGNVLALGDPSSADDATTVATPPVPPAPSADEDLPWFVGPLLAGGGNTVEPGHINIETYLFATNAYGIFNAEGKTVHNMNNFYTVTPTASIGIGVTKFMDFNATIPYVFNHTDGHTNQGAGDATFGLGFQLFKGVKNNFWHPSVRAVVSETFPTGNFEGLDPDELGTDSTGRGAYQTSFALNFQHAWQLSETKYFNDRLSLGYSLPASSEVQGVNAFGGNNETSGREHLGDQFSADLGLEYTLTKHWVPALDILYTANGKSTFAGVPGTNAEGLPAIQNGPSGEELSLAPAMEYNFNSHWGVIAGPWFSVAGRNAAQFNSAVVAVNYYR